MAIRAHYDEISQCHPNDVDHVLTTETFQTNKTYGLQAHPNATYWLRAHPNATYNIWKGIT